VGRGDRGRSEGAAPSAAAVRRGVVYRATQLHLDRRVALKLIRPEFADQAAFRRRFERESQLAASISHPNVIPVFDAGEDAGLLYIVMQLVDGIDLGRILGRVGALEPTVAARLLSQVASGLDAAHRSGLVHRDVKPANVLIPQDAPEHAFLADFGLARVVGAGTETAAPAGTADYMAPEAVDGRVVDRRADVYGLAAVVYHCLTGQVPFPSDDMRAVMWAHLHAPRPVASGQEPALPAAVDEVIARGLAPDPADRYGEAGAFMADVCGALGVGSEVDDVRT
jgi:serine/threonine-protein kinase